MGSVSAFALDTALMVAAGSSLHPLPAPCAVRASPSSVRESVRAGSTLDCVMAKVMMRRRKTIRENEAVSGQVICAVVYIRGLELLCSDRRTR